MNALSNKDVREIWDRLTAAFDLAMNYDAKAIGTPNVLHTTPGMLAMKQELEEIHKGK